MSPGEDDDRIRVLVKAHIEAQFLYGTAATKPWPEDFVDDIRGYVECCLVHAIVAASMRGPCPMGIMGQSMLVATANWGIGGTTSSDPLEITGNSPEFVFMDWVPPEGRYFPVRESAEPDSTVREVIDLDLLGQREGFYGDGLVIVDGRASILAPLISRISSHPEPQDPIHHRLNQPTRNAKRGRNSKRRRTCR